MRDFSPKFCILEEHFQTKKNVFRFRQAEVYCVIGRCASATTLPAPVTCVWSTGVLDFPAEEELLVTMYAGDCDILEENRHVTYSLSDIEFEFIDADRDYSLDSTSEERVNQAFAINSSGAVVPLLMSYRPYSFGRFILTVAATDDKGRSDTSQLKVCKLTPLYSDQNCEETLL